MNATLKLNFAHQASALTAAMPWTPSPAAGVWRKPLEREQRESGRAVRYVPGASFATHAHPMGEEFLVLSGMFPDEHGHYPAGSWLRSPHLSQHQPFSREGCTILVKVGHLPATAVTA
ncbi:Anti-ECFsigma factor, ChrR (fragment) [Thiomonas sp. X19]|uniref:cupin domain-containing protein n=1 Tax=Thiomonas sp. X19 TaxID=1050370 RepID=UPI000B6898C2